MKLIEVINPMRFIKLARTLMLIPIIVAYIFISSCSTINVEGSITELVNMGEEGCVRHYTKLYKLASVTLLPGNVVHVICRER
jgi:hypothetical protein